MTYVVTRQMQWPDGKYVVELSEGGIDYTNPDALANKYKGEFEGFDNPVEAAETAIEIMNTWKKDMPDEEVFLGYGYTGGMTMPFDDCTEEELKAWAQKTYDAIPDCEECGNKITGESWNLGEYGDTVKFCSEDCAEAYFVKNVMEEKEECTQEAK